MSLKIQDITIAEHNGRIVICRKNKRGQIKIDYKDITNELLNCITHNLSTPDNRILIYNNKNLGKLFKIDITAMTLEEEKIYKEKKKNNYKSILPFLGMMATFMGDRF